MNKRNNKHIKHNLSADEKAKNNQGLSNKFLSDKEAQKYNEHFNKHAMPFFNPPKKSDEGFLEVDVVIIEPGVLPYTYMNSDGTEFVQQEFLDSSIYAKEFLESCNGAPFVLEHPINNSGQLVNVTPENYDEVTKGVLINPRIDSATGKVLGTLKVWDKNVINSIENKELSEISGGYKCRVVPEQGNYEGTPYNLRQTNMILNHLALVDEGRAGNSVRILFNSKKVQYSEQFENFMRSEKMPKTKEQIEADKKNEALKGNTGTPPALEQEVENVHEGSEGLEGSKGLFNQEDADKFISMMKKFMGMFNNPAANIPVQNQGTPDVPKKVEGAGAAPRIEDVKKEVLNSFNSMITGSIQSRVLQDTREVQDTYARAQAVIGADVQEIASKFNSLDSFRRNILIEHIKMNKDIVDRLNSIEVKAYYDVETKLAKRDITQPRRNSSNYQGTDEVFMSIQEFANA